MMSEVLLCYGNRAERIPLSDGETEATLEKKLAETFQIPNISELFGIQDPQTRRVYSLQEILAAPFLFRSQVGTVDRSERIRTYNFPQGRVTDHRIGLSMYNITDFMNGNIGDMLGSLRLADAEAKLAREEE